MGRFDAPPPQEFFSAPRPAAGESSVVLDLGGLRVSLEGIPGELARFPAMNTDGCLY